MKKSIVGALAMVTILGLVGCQGNTETNGDKDLSKPNVQEQVENPEQVKTSYYFGQIEKIIGNEVTMKLSDDDFVVEELEGNKEFTYELTEGDIEKLEAGGIVSMPDGSTMGATTTDLGDYDPLEDPGISVEDLGEYGVEVEAGEGLMGDTNALTFNGETKSLIIPAGVSIINVMTGKEGKLSDIKEGSIVGLIMDSETNTVLSVEIMG